MGFHWMLCRDDEIKQMEALMIAHWDRNVTGRNAAITFRHVPISRAFDQVDTRHFR
jgi:hypothetical protein